MVHVTMHSRWRGRNHDVDCETRDGAKMIEGMTDRGTLYALEQAARAKRSSDGKGPGLTVAEIEDIMSQAWPDPPQEAPREIGPAPRGCVRLRSKAVPGDWV